jgi:hypothetical protein
MPDEEISSLRERWLGEEEKSLSRKRKNEVSFESKYTRDCRLVVYNGMKRKEDEDSAGSSKRVYSRSTELSQLASVVESRTNQHVCI